MNDIHQLTLFSGDEFATFSPCRRYRYTLWREWAGRSRYVQFIGLNPSTATEVHNDNTLRRCIDFAQTWGFDAMVMTNAFAYRATKPDDMKAQDEPIGSDNDVWLKKTAAGAALIVVAWGVHGSFLNRDKQILNLLSDFPLQTFGLTKEGLPRHPLMIAKNTPLIPFC